MKAPGLHVRRDLVIPADELHAAVSRSGGPGGQNVNKVATRVSLRWSVTQSRALDGAQRARLLVMLARRLTRQGDLIVHADSTRSQAQNREVARQRLAKLVRAALAVPRSRKASKPTRASKTRRHETKRRRSTVKRLRGRPSAED